MIVAIGERVNDPSMRPFEVAYCRDIWQRATIRCLHLHGMTRGRSRERLLDLLSLRPGGEFRVANLLPPDQKAGTWDKDLAELVATRLLTWIASGECRWTRILMLGKRVSETLTDDPDCQFGRVYDLCGIPALCFPHPSGRSRYLNAEEYRENARRWARKFLKEPKP